MGIKDIKNVGKAMKGLDMKDLQEKLTLGTETFNKLSTILDNLENNQLTMQENQMEFEAHLKAITENQREIMTHLDIQHLHKDFKDYE